MVLGGFCFQEWRDWVIVAAVAIIMIAIIVAVTPFYSKVYFQSNELTKSVEELLLLKGHFIHYFSRCCCHLTHINININMRDV